MRAGLQGAAAFRAASRWKETVSSAREYDVVRDGNIFGTSLSSSWIFASDHREALELRRRLQLRYEGESLSEVLGGEELETAAGVCWHIRSRVPFSPCPVDPNAARQDLLSDLTLIYGIGERTAGQLKRRGYATIPDLLSHARYRQAARAFLDLLAAGVTDDLLRWIGRWRCAAGPAQLATTALLPRDDFLFLDIETLGLFSRPVILIGAARCSRDVLEISQYLVRGVDEEQAALHAVFSAMQGDDTALVTYNGRRFDMPYLHDRAAFYRLPSPPCLPHYDMLHFARRRWAAQVPDYRLQTIEREILGIRREDDIPGAMIPEFYAGYLSDGNAGPLVPIVEHNRQDVETLARMFYRLREERYGH